jgi:hypothetical protein
LIFFKKRGNINIDLKSVVTTKRFESRFFFGLNSLEKTLKLCKYINNIFLDFVGIFEKKKDQKLGSNNAYGCMMMNVGYGLAIPRVDI